MYRKLSVLLVLFLMGCSFFPLGDNALFVSGDLTRSKRENCTIHLIYESESSARNYNIQPVSGKFSEVFSISIDKEEYTVDLICEGKQVLRRIARYPDEVGKFKLGAIQ